MSQRQWNRQPPGGARSRSSGRGWMAPVAVLLMAVLGWSVPAAAQIAPQTHIDSLYPTAFTNWQCPNGPDGGAPVNPQVHLFCLTDNWDTSYYTDSDNSNGSGDIRNLATHNLIIEREYDAKTSLLMRHQPNPNFSGRGETDIIYQQGALPGDAVGMAWCNDAVNGSTTRCDQHYVRYTSHTPITYLICHETGHALGLTHGNLANPVQPLNAGIMECMRTPIPPIGDRDPVIGPTLTTQLNAHYG